MLQLRRCIRFTTRYVGSIDGTAGQTRTFRLCAEAVVVSADETTSKEIAI